MQKNNKALLAIILVLSTLTTTNTHAQKTQVYGIGVSFQMDPELNLLPKVTEVVAATSAFTVGVQKGWHIIAVDGIKIQGKTQFELVNMIRGKEGTYVKITFARNKNLKDLQEYIIMRRKLPIKE